MNSPPTLLLNISLPLLLQQKGSSERFEDEIDGLPAYTPSLRVEVLLPQPPVLFRGQTNPIKFLVHTPSEVVGKIFVRTVNTNIRTSTTTVVGSISRRVDEKCSGSSISKVIPVDSEILELDSGACGRFFMLNLRPTFESCVMQIKHSLEIRVGISIGPEDNIYVRLFIRRSVLYMPT